MIHQISIKTKFGWVSAFEENDRIVQVKFGKYKNRLLTKNLKNFKKSIKAFMNKKSKFIKSDFSIKGSGIQKKIWNELKKIKYGKTKTYGEIAKKYKLSPRHIGKICGQNKILIFIPCHRVIKANGDLGGFSGKGGVNLKNKLLKHEKN
jgi:methylated-DNA-[protein]-cysteine S-methyltransferase